MKKASYLVLAAAGLLMASCSQDDLISGAGDGTYNITVNLPADLATRANYGQGTAQKQLQYAVYEMGAVVESGDTTYNMVINTSEDIGTNLSFNLTLNLLTGKEYVLVLFAQSTNNSVYNFNPEDYEITADYEEMTTAANSQDEYDCFFARVPLKDESASYNVNMERPVAQLNWGTSDLNANEQIESAYGENGSELKTVLTIKNVSTSLNLKTGKVEAASGDTETPFASLGVPNAQGVEYPVAPQTYKYIAMQYVLTPSTSALYDCSLEITGATGVEPKTINLTGVPMQANYRTNIYGALLSNQSDVNIDITPGFGGSNDAPLAWDGSTITIPAITNGNQVTINQPSDLAGLAAIVNGELGQTANDLSGVTVTLASDIDLNNHNFPTIGKSTRSSSNVSGNSFRGVFDGNGKTISNLKISVPESADPNMIVGFIPNLDGAGVLQNVTFENFVIEAETIEQAAVVGLLTGGAKVSGVTVSSGSVTAKEAAGGIVGRIISSGTVENCNNYANVTASVYHAGGIVGVAYYHKDGQTMTISGCNNYGKIQCTNTPSDWAIDDCGGIIGSSMADIVNCVNEGEVNSGKVSPTGGIVGTQNDYGSITGCTNKGSISGGGLVGGIVGVVGNNISGVHIVIANNTNEGVITGIGRNFSQDGSVGGIIGSCPGEIYCYGNTNSAPSLNGGGDNPAEGRNYVAGIIGQANAAYQAATGPYVSDNTNNTPLTSMSGNPKDALYNGFTAPYEP